MPISIVVQFYCSSQFHYWMKSESEVKTTELQRVKKVYPVKSPRVKIQSLHEEKKVQLYIPYKRKSSH